MCVDVGPGIAVTAFFAPAAFRLTVAVKGRGSVRSSDRDPVQAEVLRDPSVPPARLGG